MNEMKVIATRKVWGGMDVDPSLEVDAMAAVGEVSFRGLVAVRIESHLEVPSIASSVGVD